VVQCHYHHGLKERSPFIVMLESGAVPLSSRFEGAQSLYRYAWKDRSYSIVMF